MPAVVELFGQDYLSQDNNWQEIISSQICPFINKRCYKVRKSSPEISIGTCTVEYGKGNDKILICPSRLLERRQIFSDCFHLLSLHEPGNEIHVVSEISVPGGSVDYFLVSARHGKVKDFVGIELQTMDTTGTVWPERQRLLRRLGVPREDRAEDSNKSFGMNWKMTAKTILVQMHHKIHTFEHLNKKLVLVVQDKLLEYMSREFNFGHMTNPAVLGDAMHLHSYSIGRMQNGYRIELDSRLSTDADGIGICLGLQAEAKIELSMIVEGLERKLSPETLLKLG